jgi:hypothetical protein
MADWWVRRVLINIRPVFCSEGYTDFDLVAQRLFLTWNESFVSRIVIECAAEN